MEVRSRIMHSFIMFELDGKVTVVTDGAFDFFWIMRENPLRCEPLKVYKGVSFSERLPGPKSHQLELQIPFGVDAEMQEGDALRATQEIIWTGA